MEATLTSAEGIRGNTRLVMRDKLPGRLFVHAFKNPGLKRYQNGDFRLATSGELLDRELWTVITDFILAVDESSEFVNRGKVEKMPGLNAQPVSGSLSTYDQSTEDRRVAAVRKEEKKRTGVLITDQPALPGEPANWGARRMSCRV